MANGYQDQNFYNWLEANNLTQESPTYNSWVGGMSRINTDLNLANQYSSMSLASMPSVETPLETSEPLNIDAARLIALDNIAGRNSISWSGGSSANVGYGDLSAILSNAQRQQAQGAFLKTTASAVKVFDQLLTWDLRRDNINLQRNNTKQAADNQMLALDNQVLYVKNQLMDRFNQLVANNAVVMAANNLRVTAANILETSKGTAHDINKDMRTAESNAELQKINLRNQKKQADIAAKLQKTKQMTDFISASAELGLDLATGGGTGMSWGNLYNNFMQY